MKPIRESARLDWSGEGFVLPQYICSKCGEKWNPKVPAPKKCPNCQTRKWQEKKEVTKP